MDISSGLKSEIFRPSVVFIIPGIFASIPFIYFFHTKFPGAQPLLKGNISVTLLTALLITILFGLFANQVGARIETIIDHFLKKKNPEFEKEWHQYLRCAFEKEPIGQRYINHMLILYKFELNFSGAILIFGLSCIFLKVFTAFTFPDGPILLVSISFLVLIIYLLVEAYATGTALAKVRKQLLLGALNPKGT